jgi:hypothetical protein
MSDVVLSTTESVTTVTVVDDVVQVAVTNNPVEVSASTAGVQGASYNQGDPIYVTVRNATGATLPKGTIVYISGSNGNHVQVTPAIATSDATSARTLGWLAQSLANNASGLCQVEGYLEGLNTHGLTSGSQLYLSGTTAGAFTATKPQAPIHLVYVGVVTKVSAGDGHVFVKVQNGYELGELHDVQIISPTNNQVLAYDSATQLWKNATNAPDGVTSITATAPLTGGTITSTGSIGLNQSLLSITKSQVSDFTSGTVTSASTAQQAGTAVYAVNSGTAVYATTSGTAVTISGDITKSQVSDFTSGTVASASTAQQSGTAVYALTSGTATFATTSGTATYATNSGTAVFATNAGTAVGVSGSAITQSQVVNLTTDLAGKANLAGGNALTGAQTITGTATGSAVAVLTGVSGQTADLFDIRNSSLVDLFSVSAAGLITAKVVGNAGNQSRGLLLSNTADTWQSGLYLRSDAGGNPRLSLLAPTGALGEAVSIDAAAKVGIGNVAPVAQLDVYSQSASRVGQIIRGAASQSVDLLQLQNSAGTNQFRVDQAGMAIANSLGVAGSPSGISYAYFTTPQANAIPVVIRGAASQSASLTAWQNNAGGLVATMSAAGDLALYGNGITSGDHRVGTASYLSATLNVLARATTEKGLVVRGAASQTANLLEIQNSASSVLLSVTSAGNLNAPGQVRVGTTSGLGQLAVVSTNAATIGAVVQGAVSQTANLQTWQDSAGSIRARVDNTGNIFAPVVAGINQLVFLRELESGGLLEARKLTGTPANPGANSARLYFRDGTTAGTLKLVVRAGAAGAETTILDNIPQ